MLIGLRTHSLSAPDLGAARRWYATLLQIEPYYEAPYYVGFDVGGYELGLVPDAPVPTAAPRSEQAFWGVADLPAALARALELGARLVTPAHGVGEGIEMATIADPFGNHLGLIQNPHFRVPPLGSTLLVQAPDRVAAPDGVSAQEIVLDALLPAPPAAVWACWTSAAGLAWLVPAARVELRLGGPFELYFLPEAPKGQQGSEGCVVLAFLPERLLSFTWNAPPNQPLTRAARTFVVMTFEPEGSGTRLRLTHAGWPAGGPEVEGSPWAQTFAYFERAWAQVLRALQAHLAGTV